MEGVAEVKTANRNEAIRAHGNRAQKTPRHVTIGGLEKPMSGYNPDVINEEKRRYGIPHNYPQKGERWQICHRTEQPAYMLGN